MDADLDYLTGLCDELEWETGVDTWCDECDYKPGVTTVWSITKKWNMNDFKTIYFGCRFYFTELILEILEHENTDIES